MARRSPWSWKFLPAPLVLLGLLFLSAPLRHLSAQEQTKAIEKLPPGEDTGHRSATGPEDEHDRDDLLFPLKRDLWFEQQRAYPGKVIPKGAYWHARAQREALLSRHRALMAAREPGRAAVADSFSGVTWTPDGPQPAASYYGTIPYSGRATAIAVHPTDPNTVYLGTAAGGVWKTTDGGQTWTPLTDSQASLAIGAVAVDPNNPTTIFAGTGEPDSSTDSYYGQGLLKSTDAGATWTLIRSPFTAGDTAPDFTAIVVQPGNSNLVLAANQAGVYRSADGGTTWAQVVNGCATALIFDTKNTSVLYTGTGCYSNALGPLLKSTDAGQTWTAIEGTGANTVPAAPSVFRTAITESSDGSTLFAAFAKSDFTAPGSLYRSTDGGANWTPLSPPSATDGLDWYRNAIAVVPGNPLVLYASGASLYESVDGGKTWAQNTGGIVYADQHTFAFSADGSRMYLADDGGIFVTANPAQANAVFTSLNTAVNSMTFYPGFSLLPGKPNSALAGSQDHGLNLYTGALAWPNGEQSGICGDGGSVYVDPQGKYAYAHCQGSGSGIHWAANPTADASTTSWVGAQSGIDTATDRLPWVADIKGDQQTISTVYTGTNRLYQSTNNAVSWTAISGDLTGGNSVITTIGVSPTDSNTIYVGAGDGTVSATGNALMGAAATWTTVTGLPIRAISKISVQPDSAKDVYLTVSGFDTGHVFHSTNGGSSWTDISGDLPNTPVNSILVDPSLSQTIYLATDTGVYVTENGGTNWLPLGKGLPNVVVQDILMDPSTRTLRVISHGRGAWDAILPGVPGVNLSSSSLAFGNQPVAVASAAQSVQFGNTGATPVANIAVTIGGTNAGDFAQTNTCGTTLAAGANCTITATFTPGAPGARSATLSIADNAAGAPQTVALSGTGVAPFTISAATTSATVSAGSSASYTLSLAAATGFPLGAAVQLSCSGAPTLSTCTLSPTSVASGASSAQTITVSVTTTAATTSQLRREGDGAIVLAGMSLIGLLLLPVRRRGAPWLALMLLCVGAGIALTGCGGGGSTNHGSPGTPSGSYTLTITAAQGTTYQATQPLTLVVQ
jgi:photosystem II stability/assembly factor-like uncharacterized protein